MKPRSFWVTSLYYSGLVALGMLPVFALCWLTASLMEETRSLVLASSLCILLPLILFAALTGGYLGAESSGTFTFISRDNFRFEIRKFLEAQGWSLKHEDSSTMFFRNRLARVFAEISPDSARIIGPRTLINKMAHSEALTALTPDYAARELESIKKEFPKGLGTISSPDKSIMEQLLATRLVEDEEVIWRVASAVGKMGDARAIKPLLAAQERLKEHPFLGLPDIVHALEAILKRVAPTISQDDLDTLGQLADVPYIRFVERAVYVHATDSYEPVSEKFDELCDCSNVRQLARQERTRRALESAQ